ncbi:MAG: heavy-metal-associated domain-containing protein [Burkholderiales bacterium]|nr:heavy-metal-associated domain-containing protein [Burkholderiales bacterium]
MAAALCLVLAASGALAASPTYRLHVDGLSCPFCAYGLEKKLGAIKGVQRIETNIKDGAVIVTMQEGLALDEATAKQAVKEAGFSLRKLEQVQSAPQGAAAGERK